MELTCLVGEVWGTVEDLVYSLVLAGLAQLQDPVLPVLMVKKMSNLIFFLKKKIFYLRGTVGSVGSIDGAEEIRTCIFFIFKKILLTNVVLCLWQE